MVKTVNHLADFLQATRAVRGTGGGTKETSYYPALSNLFDAVGTGLKPKVRAVMQLKNLGAGNPDGGLFTQDQFDHKTGEAKNLAAPARGVIEVKSPAEAVDDTAVSEQIDKYWTRYRLVLVTNLRDWLLIGERQGKRVDLERHTLAASETAFWKLSEHPDKAQKAHGEAFADFLARVLRHAAPLADPKDLAWLLASYAREARHRVEHAPPAAEKQLGALKNSLETALGVEFNTREGEHFFRSTLVQTLFYGVFAAWVLRHQQGTAGRFVWRMAAFDLHVPMIAALYDQLSHPSKLKALSLTEVLDWAGDALGRVDTTTFFKRFQVEDSVQYFYEPFLEAFDPELRKQLGVWYTPREIVRYQVARVDQALRKELGIADGLADPRVVVLDPCCGTGAYLLEVLHVIARRLEAQGGGALVGHELKHAAMTRIFGFELLPAPYVVAHLQLGLLLHRLKSPLKNDTETGDERAGVYLTNALTGWEPAEEPKTGILAYPELAAERDAANRVKRGQHILVILGNPPYNGYAGVAVHEERTLTEAYRQTRQGPQPQGQGLNDLYVRFFRMAERQIVEHTGQGVVCFISNYSWLDGLSHPAMRERYLAVFDQISIDNLHGNRIISEYAPDGRTSETVFAVQGSSPGIKIGTAIALLVRQDNPNLDDAIVRYADFEQARADERRHALLASLDSAGTYTKLLPNPTLGYPFKPSEIGKDYLAWPRLPELFPISFPGVKTSRDAALVDVDRAALEARMRRYFDPAVSDADIAREMPALMESTARFDAPGVRQALLTLGQGSGRIVRYAYRPFDTRWLYWHPETKLLDEKRPDYLPQVFAGNGCLVSQQKPRRDWSQAQFIGVAGCLDLMDRSATCIPLKLCETTEDLLGAHTIDRPNLSKAAADYLAGLDAESEALFFHALAVLHSAAYRAENAGALRQDWPRIPLPKTLARLRASTDLGRRVAALLDTETPVAGVTAGDIRPELRPLAGIVRRDGQPLEEADFALTAGWGHAGKDGVTMPGRGRVEARAVPDGEMDARLGDRVLDVYLNDRACWFQIPEPVWEYTLGGYQVLKKWLSYREQSLLGRPLGLDEIKEFTAATRRIAALVLLRADLDANYRALAAHAQSGDHAAPQEPPHDTQATPAPGTPPEDLARTASGRGQPARGLPPAGAGIHPEFHGAGERAGGPGAGAGVADSTRPLDATRELASAAGPLTYTEVSERLAAKVADSLDDLFDAAPDDIAIAPDWIRDIHRRLAVDLFPEWGGCFRTTDVQVGTHFPPPAHAVAVQVRDFCLDLEERLRHLAGAESIADLLAWVDWRFQWIHPFKDFNGRVGRILLVALMYKLGLPPVDPAGVEYKEDYFAALRAADAGDLAPLAEMWFARLERWTMPP
jgi:fido (protein-threonine AMPylation protein)